MAAIPGSVRVTGFIAPSDSIDSYPSHDALYGMDGWRSVANAAARNAVPDARRRAGMIVFQQDIEVFLRLKTGPWAGTDADWTGDINMAGILSGFQLKIVVDGAAAISLSDAVHRGAILVCTSAVPVALSIPDTVAALFSCTVVQFGAGVITAAGTGSMVLNSYLNMFKTAGQFAGYTVIVPAANSALMMGNTAT